MIIMSLGIAANKEKNGALLAYIAKNVPNIHLRKLLGRVNQQVQY